MPFASDTTVATLMGRIDKLMPVSAELGPLAGRRFHERVTGMVELVGILGVERLELGFDGLLGNFDLEPRAETVPVQYTPDEWDDLLGFIRPHTVDPDGAVAACVVAVFRFGRAGSVLVVQFASTDELHLRQ